jgi:hypothetical protein
MKVDMKMNKKTVIQLVVLVLLVIAAAGAFFLQQEGGLDSLMSYFEDKPAATTPAKKTEAAAPAPKPKPKPAEPTIPAHPAKGQLAGKDFTVDGASVEAGTLTLRQGQSVEVRISGLTRNWEVPAGRKFKFSNATGANLPVVTVQRQEEGQPPTRQEVTGKYTLLLEFGAEQNNKLPGKLLLTLPETAKGTVGGTFEADITGFRLVDGKPDLGADSIETLQFLALREMLKDDPDKPLNDTVLRDMRYTVGEGKQVSTGYLEASYRVGEGLPMTQRYQFVKEKGEWRVLRTLRTDQIDEAHPFKAPTSRDKPEILFPHLVAKKLEADTQKKYPKKGIFVTEYATRYSLKHKVGECEVKYRLEGNEQPITARYILRDKGKGWVLERELGAKEKLNVDTGKIVKST